jgi:hypothetical protein
VSRGEGRRRERAGEELIFGYTTASSPWLHEEQGARRFLVMERQKKRERSGNFFFECVRF